MESLSCLLTFYSEHFKDLKVELQSSFLPFKTAANKTISLQGPLSSFSSIVSHDYQLQMSFYGLWAQSEETYCISDLDLCRSTEPSWNRKVKDADKRQ